MDITNNFIYNNKKNGKPLFRFLNIPLVILSDKGLCFLSIIIFVIMAFYLLITTVKGNFKFWLRIIILGQIHPMKKR